MKVFSFLLSKFIESIEQNVGIEYISVSLKY